MHGHHIKHPGYDRCSLNDISHCLGLNGIDRPECGADRAMEWEFGPYFAVIMGD